jgi:hypothetical protein
VSSVVFTFVAYGMAGMRNTGGAIWANGTLTTLMSLIAVQVRGCPAVDEGMARQRPGLQVVQGRTTLKIIDCSRLALAMSEMTIAFRVAASCFTQSTLAHCLTEHLHTCILSQPLCPENLPHCPATLCPSHHR